MLSTFEIITIIVIVIDIAIAVYLLTRTKKDTPQTQASTLPTQPTQPIQPPQPTQPPLESTLESTQSQKSEIQNLIDGTLRVFGIKVKETFKQERFSDTLIFNTIDDIPKNMPTFIKYAFSKLDMNQVNTLLNTYDVTKTADQIFNANINLTYDQFTADDKFGSIFEMLEIYSGIIFEETDMNTIMNYMRLELIIIIAIGGLAIKKEIVLPNSEYKVNGEKYNLTDIYFELPKDFLLNNYIKIYTVTNLNKDKQDNNTEFVGDKDVTPTKQKNVGECLTTILCNDKLNIESTDLSTQRQEAIANMTDIKKLCNLMFVRSLMRLNNTVVPVELNTEITNLYNKLNAIIQ